MRKFGGRRRETELPAVQVSLAAARNRDLPLVSVRSGRRADGYAPAGRPSGSVFLPLTQSEFDRLMSMRKRQRTGLYGIGGFVVAGMAMAKFAFILYLGVIISLVSALIWVVATLGIMKLLPAVDIDETRGTVALGRVHRRFVGAVSDSSR